MRMSLILGLFLLIIAFPVEAAPVVDSLSIDAGPTTGSYPALEGGFTIPIRTLPGSTMSGPTTYVGLACSPIPSGSGIAVILREACRFDLKAQNAIDAGYSGMVVFNRADFGDALVTMGGDPRNIPGVFVGHSTGLAIFNVASASDLSVGQVGAPISAVADAEPGACVFDPSTCGHLPHSICTLSGGTFEGPGTICPSPPEAIPEYPTAAIPALIGIAGYLAIRHFRKK